MDFSAQFTTDDQTGKGDASNFEVIWGVQGDRGGIVLSASYLNREEINVDEKQDEALKYGIMSVPVILILEIDKKKKTEKVVDSIYGVVPKDELLRRLKA